MASSERETEDDCVRRSILENWASDEGATSFAERKRGAKMKLDFLLPESQITFCASERM